MLGRPNVGKSSIINALLDEKVAAVSEKPQTTRNAIRCIYTTNNEQIVFVDTPGIHKPKHALGDFMLKEAENALSQVDLVCFVVEAQDRTIGEKEEMIISVLSELKLPVVLVINKIDKLNNMDYVQKASKLYTDRISPVSVVSISASKKINLELLISEISRFLPHQPAIYPADILMDSTERFLAAEVIREKIFHFTEDEVPHGVAVVIDDFKSPDEYPDMRVAKIRATIVVDRPGQKGIIIGKGGLKLKAIGTEARLELEKKFGYPVFLELWVKVKPNWRKSLEELRRLGYGF